MEYMLKYEPMHYHDLMKRDTMSSGEIEDDTATNLERYFNFHFSNLTYFSICNHYIMRIIFLIPLILICIICRKKMKRDDSPISNYTDYLLFQFSFAYWVLLLVSHVILLFHKLITDFIGRAEGNKLFLLFTFFLSTSFCFKTALFLHTICLQSKAKSLGGKIIYTIIFLVISSCIAVILISHKEKFNYDFQIIIDIDHYCTLIIAILFVIWLIFIYKGRLRIEYLKSPNTNQFIPLCYFIFLIPYAFQIVIPGSYWNWDAYISSRALVSDIVYDWQAFFVLIFFNRCHVLKLDEEFPSDAIEDRSLFARIQSIISSISTASFNSLTRTLHQPDLAPTAENPDLEQPPEDGSSDAGSKGGSDAGSKGGIELKIIKKSSDKRGAGSSGVSRTPKKVRIQEQEQDQKEYEGRVTRSTRKRILRESKSDPCLPYSNN